MFIFVLINKENCVSTVCCCCETQDKLLPFVKIINIHRFKLFMLKKQKRKLDENYNKILGQKSDAVRFSIQEPM